MDPTWIAGAFLFLMAVALVQTERVHALQFENERLRKRLKNGD